MGVHEKCSVLNPAQSQQGWNMFPKVIFHIFSADFETQFEEM